MAEQHVIHIIVDDMMIPQARLNRDLHDLLCCRVIYLQVSMNEGLSYITSSVHITTTECVSTNCTAPNSSTSFRAFLLPLTFNPSFVSFASYSIAVFLLFFRPSSLSPPLLCLSTRGGREYRGQTPHPQTPTATFSPSAFVSTNVNVCRRSSTEPSCWFRCWWSSCCWFCS